MTEQDHTFTSAHSKQWQLNDPWHSAAHITFRISYVMSDAHA